MIRSILAPALLALACIPLALHAETFDTCTGFIDSVPTNIDTQGVWCLRKDVATNQAYGEAIRVSANNVTIDCNGYKVGGLAAGVSTKARGVFAYNRKNLTVRNCNIRGFEGGIVLDGADSAGHRVENNSLNQNIKVGIAVEGRGGLISGNMVLDTGGGPPANIVYELAGIRVIGNIDVRGNTVDGVFGGASTNAYTTGIFIESYGTDVSSNTVRNLAPDGTGKAFGIRLFGSSSKIFLNGNRVSLPAAVSGSVAYRCESLMVGAIRNSSSWGFEMTTDTGCYDSGGNVLY